VSIRAKLKRVTDATAISVVHVASDFRTNQRTDRGAENGREDAIVAVADLIANHAACNTAEDSAYFLAIAATRRNIEVALVFDA
jgi:hypothetical protein